MMQSVRVLSWYGRHGNGCARICICAMTGLSSTGHLIVLASMICQIHTGCRYNLQYYCICLYNTRIPQPTNVHGHVITGTVLFESASSTRNIYCAGEVLKHKQMYWKPLQCLHHQYQHVIPVTNLFGYCVLARFSKQYFCTAQQRKKSMSLRGSQLCLSLSPDTPCHAANLIFCFGTKYNF